MELYFEKPSLVRAFYYGDTTDFTCYHRHDENLQIQRKNVIYLYRNPVDTIYSVLNHYAENHNDMDRIKYWTDSYGQHLKKWLVEETFTSKKTLITYEGMMKNIEEEFRKICIHFSTKFNRKKLNYAVKKVTKMEVSKMTTHDMRVMDLSDFYQQQKQLFIKNRSLFILDSLLNIKELENFILPLLK